MGFWKAQVENESLVFHSILWVLCQLDLILLLLLSVPVPVRPTDWVGWSRWKCEKAVEDFFDWTSKWARFQIQFPSAENWEKMKILTNFDTIFRYIQNGSIAHQDQAKLEIILPSQAKPSSPKRKQKKQKLEETEREQTD